MSQLDEGYIKFKPNWTPAPPLPESAVFNLNYWRSKMYALRLIGAYDNGIGFGNISERMSAQGEFLISGTATGNFEQLTAAHYALVRAVDIEQNSLDCEGMILASSESMSHAVLYRECPEVHGVIHAHHLQLWQHLLHRVPTTDRSATYGTPEMAKSIIQLLKETPLRSQRIFVMEGHEEGIFAFGESLEAAAAVLVKHLQQLPEKHIPNP